jgi:hypothetical protein
MQYSMVRPLIYALILIIGLPVLVAANDTAQLRLLHTYRLDQPVRYFTIDNLGAYYIITRRNELIKFDEQGQWIGNHRQQVLGDLRSVDVVNPLQLLLFYPEFSTLLQLDNMLYQTNRFEIGGLQLGEHSQVCRSFDNNFWVYDERAFRLRKLAFDLRTVVEGEWLQNEFKGGLAPSYLVEHMERVYLNDPQRGILVFDLYGRYLKTLPITGIDRIDFFGDQLFYIRSGNLYRYHLRALKEEPLVLPPTVKARMVRVNQRGIYVLGTDAIFLMQLTAP